VRHLRNNDKKVNFDKNDDSGLDDVRRFNNLGRQTDELIPNNTGSTQVHFAPYQEINNLSVNKDMN